MITVERLRARPVEVDAVQFTGFGPGGNGWAVLDWLHQQGVDADRLDDNVRARTTETRDATAYPGWTFIVGTQGEVYPISPAVRATKYEPVQP